MGAVLQACRPPSLRRRTTARCWCLLRWICSMTCAESERVSRTCTTAYSPRVPLMHQPLPCSKLSTARQQQAEPTSHPLLLDAEPPKHPGRAQDERAMTGFSPTTPSCPRKVDFCLAVFSQFWRFLAHRGSSFTFSTRFLLLLLILPVSEIVLASCLLFSP